MLVVSLSCIQSISRKVAGLLATMHLSLWYSVIREPGPCAKSALRFSVAKGKGSSKK